MNCKRYVSIITKWHSSSNLSRTQSQAEQAEKQIKAEFERLRQVLCAEEAARLKALADEEEDKRSRMEERISSLTSDIAALTKLVQTVKREMGAEDLTFLQVSRRGLPHGGGSWVSLSLMGWGSPSLILTVHCHYA